jgi:hypothetical protein
MVRHVRIKGYEVIQPDRSISFGKPGSVCFVYGIHSFCKRHGDPGGYGRLVLTLPLSYPMFYAMCGDKHGFDSR